MAQVFEVPGETGQRILPFLAIGLNEPPQRNQQRFQIAAPGPTIGRIGVGNMGLPPDCRKR